MVMFEYEWLLRLFAALAAGFIIGLERHNRAKEPGIRTHALVALASCVLMLISKYGFRDIGTGDPGRVAASVVSGIGFLGAGAIFIRHDAVQGLTTAAGIWSTSAIGLGFGSGMYVIGVVATALTYIVQHYLLRYFPHNSSQFSMALQFRVHMTHDSGIIEVLRIVRAHHFHPIGESRFISDKQGGWCLLLEAVTHKDELPEAMIKELERSEKITSVEIL